jgi:HEAT repeat protein
MVTSDDSPMARLACAFALQKLGRNYVGRIVDMMNNDKVIQQAQDYLIELGPAILGATAPRLQDPDVTVRAAVADVLGVIGDTSTLPLLETATKDTDAQVAAAAKRAIVRLRAK